MNDEFSFVGAIKQNEEKMRGKKRSKYCHVLCPFLGTQRHGGKVDLSSLSLTVSWRRSFNLLHLHLPSAGRFFLFGFCRLIAC